MLAHHCSLNHSMVRTNYLLDVILRIMSLRLSTLASGMIIIRLLFFQFKHDSVLEDQVYTAMTQV